MYFKTSKTMKIALLPEQEQMLSSKQRMEEAFLDPDVLAFDIYFDNLLIGFAMVKKWDNHSYFLWNYAIDYKYQNCGYGTNALIELIEYLHRKHNLQVMTTTYTLGNSHAKHVYEKIGFKETSIVDTDGYHEVNMTYQYGTPYRGNYVGDKRNIGLGI